MKKILTALTFLYSTALMSAQTAGTITYTETVKLQLHFEGNMPPPPGLPTEHVNHTVLYFNNDASLYTNDESKQQEDVNVDEETEDGGRMVLRMDAPQNKVYCDFKNKKVTRLEDFMQRNFLVEGEIKTLNWKFTGNQKMILNYPCQEAIVQDTIEKVVVWFTSAIPVSAGPLRYHGLPGAVLEVNVNDGGEIITATEIKKEVDASLIEKPKDGKKVTQEEFQKIVAEKMKEMGIEGDGPQIIIRVNDN
ncbi:MAG: GLPGLI family protein [Chitinophagales bacterium]|nr:GLPGLI family protein [Chitinophagales bacterium]